MSPMELSLNQLPCCPARRDSLYNFKLKKKLNFKCYKMSLSADVAEIKRVTTTDTYLHTLHKYTNYSIQVLAFTNAGDGKRSPPVFCMTEEDGELE